MFVSHIMMKGFCFSDYGVGIGLSQFESGLCSWHCDVGKCFSHFNIRLCLSHWHTRLHTSHCNYVVFIPLEHLEIPNLVFKFFKKRSTLFFSKKNSVFGYQFIIRGFLSKTKFRVRVNPPCYLKGQNLLFSCNGGYLKSHNLQHYYLTYEHKSFG